MDLRAEPPNKYSSPTFLKTCVIVANIKLWKTVWLAGLKYFWVSSHIYLATWCDLCFQSRSSALFLHCFSIHLELSKIWLHCLCLLLLSPINENSWTVSWANQHLFWIHCLKFDLSVNDIQYRWNASIETCVSWLVGFSPAE